MMRSAFARARPWCSGRLRNLPPRRLQSSPPPNSDRAARTRSRIEKLNARLPTYLREYTAPLLSAPLSHTTSFLLLHEITAVVPLLGFAAGFHYFGPPEVVEDWLRGSEVLREGEKRWGRYLRKKGWIDEAEAEEAREAVEGEHGVGEKGSKKVRVVVELASAYALTKVLLPLRVVVSLWATPWFARTTVIPITNIVRRLFGKNASHVAKKG